jgi:hypothetical protein
MTDIQLGRVNTSNIIKTEVMGLLTEITLNGRSYDPDPTFHFTHPQGHKIFYVPPFTMTEAYIEYEPDTEEKSKQRILERTEIMKPEILGNDWALRPENVLQTQDISIKQWNTTS